MGALRDPKVIGSDRVTAIGLGTWGIGGYESPDYSRDEESVEVLRYGLELGINLIDTAEFYGAGHSEELVGRAIEGFDRDELFIISKVWPTNFGYERTKKAVRASAKRLGTYIDLHLLHWPGTEWRRIEETLHALEELVDEGVVRYIGVSNFDLELLKRSQEAMRKYEIVANEVKYSLRDRWPETSGLLDYMKKEKIALIAYTPLEKGSLARNPCLAEIGRKYGKTSAQVALNYLIWEENVVAIPKAGRKEHVEENAGAMSWRLSREDREKARRCV
ncbi:aldo/keto reductase [Thermococcus nautili]|uniref:Aldo/keto reductase, related to diketogulonate reductase n=1 Tax=Thermococcus nautili TaxID=195522 RepID=W8PID5_9EURY|nr:aldo/keto reductase [Thermococcus nautili]AHL21884.1 Aldo/keto reductase, related to diketogulonate reductase [Thermococcus nautili]